MDSQSFSFLDERQYFALRIEIHLYAIATANLIGRDKPTLGEDGTERTRVG